MDRLPGACALLSQVTRILAESADEIQALQGVARAVVPHWADWCSVDVTDTSGRLVQVALTHVEPAGEMLARDLRRRYPPTLESRHAIFEVLASGQSQVVEQVDDADLVARARDTEHLCLLRALEIRSHLVVPMRARGATLGALSLVLGPSGRRYTVGDLTWAEDLGRACALALDHARLREQATQALEARTAFMTWAAHELRTPLTGLRAYAQLLLRTRAVADPDSALAERALRTISEETERLARAISQMVEPGQRGAETRGGGGTGSGASAGAGAGRPGAPLGPAQPTASERLESPNQ